MNDASRKPRVRSGQLSRRRLLGYTAAGAGTAGLLAACGGHTNSATSGPANSGAASGKLKPGGQINLSTNFDVPSFDIGGSNDKQTATVLLHTNDSLLGFKSGPQVKFTDLTLESRLAERWEVPDAQTYTFHLRPGLKFANLPPVNGRACTSADVKWTFEYLSRTGPFKGQAKRPVAELLQGLSSIDTPDDQTVVAHFSAPFAPFLSYAAIPHLSVLPHEIQEQDGDFTKRMVGTGPWQFDPSSSQKGARQFFKRNPDYYMPGRPYIDTINQLILPEDSTVEAAFRTKQVDILDHNGLTLQTVQQIKKAFPDVVEYDYLSISGGLLYINVTRPPMNDLRIRRAISLCLDRDAMIQSLANGKGQWALAGGIPGLFTDAETRQLLKPDPAQAKQLVTAAGFPNGVDVELMYPGAKYGQIYVSLIQLLQQQVKQGGVNLSLKNLDKPTEGARKKSGDFQIDITGKDVLVDLDDYLYGVYDPKSAHNYGHVNDPELTPLLEAQRREPDLAKRKDLWRQAIKRIADQAWGVAFFYPQTAIAWWPYVKNYGPNWGSEVSEPITNCWLEK